MSVQSIFRGRHGYKSHQLNRRAQVVGRSLKPINRQGFKKCGGQFTFSSVSAEGNFGEGSYCGFSGTEGWTN